MSRRKSPTEESTPDSQNTPHRMCRTAYAVRDRKDRTMINPNAESEVADLEVVETVLTPVDFEVTMERLHLANGTQTPAFATVRKDNGKVLGVVGERYTPLQNSVLFSQVETLFKNSGHRYEDLGYKVIDGGRQVKANFRFPDITMFAGTQECALTIAVQNSFDGSLKVAFDVGFFRFICSNGLKIPLFKGSTVSLMKKHTQSLNLDFAQHALTESVNQIGEARNVFTEWTRTAVTQGEGHKVLNGLVTHKAMTARLAEGVREIWDKPTYREDADRNVFNLYNAVTEHLTHQVSSKRFNLSEKVGHDTAKLLRAGVRNGIQSLFVDSLPERKERSYN